MISPATEDRLVKLIDSALPDVSLETFLGPANRESRKQLKVNLIVLNSGTLAQGMSSLTLATSIALRFEESIKTKGREQKSYLNDIGRKVVKGLLDDRTLNDTVVNVNLDNLQVIFAEELNSKYVMTITFGVNHDIA